MSPQSLSEAKFEAAIEWALTGTTTEELRQQGLSPADAPAPHGGHGYYVGNPHDFDPHYALDTRRLLHFLETTQPDSLARFQRASDWRSQLFSNFDKLIRRYGLLYLLRNGISIGDVSFELFYSRPAPHSSEAAWTDYRANEFSVSRQVRHHPDHQERSIDMVIFANGIPLLTLELKNALTGQSAAHQGQQQYMRRDFHQPLLSFGRCLVHFTADTDEVYMSTRLMGKATNFLPFNRGHRHGKGNPPNSDGYKTAYLWQDVFHPDSLAEFIRHFSRFSGSGTRNEKLSQKALFFPRYHQRDVVRELVRHARENGTGHSYLVQHSAGSGKSLSIAWTAYQLIEVYPERADLPGARGLTTQLFDSVIIVTDRRLLDKQIKRDVKSMSQVKSIFGHATKSDDLRRYMESGKRIIVTTLQKFPHVIEEIGDLSHKRFAVLIDEAHSSQGGTTTMKMNQSFGGEADPDDPDAFDRQDYILQELRKRQAKANVSYIAFTATPKNSTLERFGTRQPDGSFRPFHLYSMKQAIEEGFILDVLANYTTYRSFYQIQKAIADNPEFEVNKAQKRLRSFVEANPVAIKTKAGIMLEHFIGQVVETKKLRGKAKGMVVTKDISTAIRYYLALKKRLEELGRPFGILVAFSGKKTVDGIEYTEDRLNGFAESKTREKFDTDEYRLLVVANKYLTGFDQKKLCAMYVDKKLQGVLAVQALSRLNRANAKLGKRTEDLFVLDFFNTATEIKAAFDPFYTSTTLSEATDVNVLHELLIFLNSEGVYEWSEVEEFTEGYFRGRPKEELEAIIDIAEARFNHELGLEEEEKADFKIKAKQFVKIYGQIAAITRHLRADWEQAFWFLKFLIPKLKVKTRQDQLIDDLLESVDLGTYALSRTRIGAAIPLEAEESELDPQNPNPRSAHSDEEQRNPLDEIISDFNARFYAGWDETPEEARVKVVSILRGVQAHKDYAAQVANNPDRQNSALALEKIVDEVMRQKRDQQLEEFKRYLKDQAYQQGMIDLIRRMLDLGL